MSSEDSLQASECVNWIQDGKYLRVCLHILAALTRKTALQLPDSLLPRAYGLVQLIQTALLSMGNEKSKVYILGDTSYGSCCVDEVAAEHVNCDSIIHFGPACLSECVNSQL